MNILDQVITDKYAIYNSDCMAILPTIPDESIHLSVYSPPFCGLFHYSSSERDMSNCRTYQEFFDHYEFLVRELHRVTMPGRISAVHAMDVPNDGANAGAGLTDFPGDIVRVHCQCKKRSCTASTFEKLCGKCGHGDWQYIARHCVWKEPLGVRNRTMAKGLTHKAVIDDSSLCDVASADYLLLFRRSGTNPVPITHPTGLMSYAGERQVPSDVLKYRGWKGSQLANRYSQWVWRQYASSFWDDVRISRVLPYKAARDPEDERHMHPLQLDVIERVVVLRSNPGETVFTPFMGVGSEPFGAVINGRKAVGVELKPSYYRQALKNLQAASEIPTTEQADLFSSISEPHQVESSELD